MRLSCTWNVEMKSGQPLKGRARQKYSEQPSYSYKKETLDQHGSNQICRRGTERFANGGIAQASGNAGKVEIGYIDANHDQQCAYSRQQQSQAQPRWSDDLCL